MPQTRLNLPALRAGRVPWLPETRARDGDAGAPPSPVVRVAPVHPITRRHLFGLAAGAAGAIGAGAAGAAPLVRALAADTPRDFDLTVTPERAVFSVGGRVRWTIDLGRLAGPARLSVDRGEDAIDLRLTGARFPGTDLSADLEAHIWRTGNGWRMRLAFPDHDLVGEVPFVAWLVGESALHGRARIAGARQALGRQAHLALGGSATASFQPDWTLRLAGTRIGRIEGLAPAPESRSGEPGSSRRSTLDADTVSIRLPHLSAPSLLDPPAARRSLVTLTRGDRAWRLRPALPVPDGAGLNWRAEPFDSIYIECAQSQSGTPRHILIAEASTPQLQAANTEAVTTQSTQSTSSTQSTASTASTPPAHGPPLVFHPGPGAFSLAGQPFGLPLARLRYAITFDTAGDRHLVLGWLGAAAPWLMTAAGTALRLGDPQGGDPAFELAAGGGARAAIDVAPRIDALRLPLGRLIHETRLPPDARVRWEWPGDGGGGRSRVAGDPLIGRSALVAHPPLLGRPPLAARSGTGAQSPAAPRSAEAVRLRFTADGAEAITQAAALDLVVLRPDDLLALGFTFDNLLLRAGANPGDPQRLVAADTGRPSRIVVHFPPQHITEQASLDEGQPELVAPTPPIRAALAGPSRLSFSVPAAAFPNGVPFTLAALLDWAKLAPTPGPNGTVRAPTAFETALILPYRLVLHPENDDKPAWAHALLPVTHDGRTELWHTRLGTLGADGSPETAGSDQVNEREQPRLRAVWTESFADQPLFLGCNHPLAADPFQPMSLSPGDRKFLALLTGAGDNRVDARRLFLSALGGWLDVTWNRSAGNNNCQTPLEAWTHKAAMGRDFFVRLVYRGNLLPFGHRASLIKITERKFERNANEDTVASLWQRLFLIVREPEKTYNNRKLPFRRVRITTEVTPSLRLTSPKAKLGALPPDETGGFWPIVLVNAVDTDFPFHLVAEDWDGRQVELTMPLAWLAEGASEAIARSAYNAETGARVLRPMGGQKIAYAPGSTGGGLAKRRKRSERLGAVGTDGARVGPQPPAPSPERHGRGGVSRDGATGVDRTASVAHLTAEGGAGDTSFETMALTFAMDAAGLVPVMKRAGVIAEPLKQLIGDRTPVDIIYEDTYVAHGFAAAQNAAEVFAKLESKLPINFGGGGKGDRGGGLVTPNFDVSGLSRKLGLAGGDLAALAGGAFDPADFLDVAALANKAKILGYNILEKILAVIPPAEFGDGESVPKITSRVDVPAQLSITEIDWSPEIIEFIPFRWDQGGTSDFTIHAELRAKLDAGAGASADFDVSCELTYFAIDLVAIKLSFASLQFQAGSGKATSLVPIISNVAFGGPLKFVEKLKDVLSSDVLGAGPKIDVTPTGILAGIDVGLPAVAVGVFSLENIRLSAALNLPLTGEPVRFRFAFCERQSPFVLTVSAFGGGGFVAIHLGADGLAKLEMALEFGAQLSMSIGIASGSVGVMAGIYLELTKVGDTTEVELTGYLRCWGRLDILGIISISAEFYLGFTYYSASNSCRGQAKLTVKIEILFFEKTFTLSVEREFGGAKGGAFLLSDTDARSLADGGHDLAEAPAGGIAFADLYDEADWMAYAEAFG